MDAPHVQHTPALVLSLVPQRLREVGPRESSSNDRVWKASSDDRNGSDIDPRFLGVLEDQDLGLCFDRLRECADAVLLFTATGRAGDRFLGELSFFRRRGVHRLGL